MAKRAFWMIFSVLMLCALLSGVALAGETTDVEQVYTVTFEVYPPECGMLEGDTAFEDIPHGAFFDAAVPHRLWPQPKAGEGYMFVGTAGHPGMTPLTGDVTVHMLFVPEGEYSGMVVFEAASADVPYDGQEHEVSGYTITGSGANDITVDGTLEAKAVAKNASDTPYPVAFVGETEAQILRNGEPLPEDVGILFVPGTLRIRQLSIELTAKNATIQQGDSLPPLEVEHTGGTFAEGEGLDDVRYAISVGEHSAVGNHAITVSAVRGGNYAVQGIPGVLTVMGRVYYDANGIAADLYTDPSVYALDDEITLLTQEEAGLTEAGGRTFAGWALSADGDAEYQPGDTIQMGEDSVTLYAVWAGGEETAEETAPETDAPMQEATAEPGEDAGMELVLHKVTYLDVDGSLILETQALSGEPVLVKPDPPATSGGLFLFWYDVDVEELKAFDFDTPITADKTLQAYQVLEKQSRQLESPLKKEIIQLQPRERAVSVRMDTDGPLRLGDSVSLHAVMTGYEGADYSLQWQYRDGTEWKDIAGANGQKLDITINEENAGYAWRLIVRDYRAKDATA